jgi:plasmid stability protein
MARTLTLRNVPDEVVRELRRRAKRSGRSMQRELLTVVQQATVDTRSLENSLAAIRRDHGRRLRLSAIHAAIREGRP